METLERTIDFKNSADIVEINENSETNIPILINIPQAWQFKQPITDLADVAKFTEEKIANLDQLLHSAFIENNKSAWDQVQQLLYVWNIKDITKQQNRNDYRYIAETILRDRIYSFVKQSKPKATLDCYANFTPERATQELFDKAHGHRINNHPLLLEMNKNGLPMEAVRTFLDNYYVNNRFFHLFVAIMSLFTPLERRTELANNFYDELGSGDSAMVHPILFLKNYATIGLSEKINPTTESLNLLNSKLNAAYLSGDYHYAMGGFGFIELTMPKQMEKIYAGFQNSKLPEKDLIFWKTHIIIDLEHGKTWFEEIRELLKHPDEAVSSLQGGLDLLEARARMYDGIWNHINGNS